MYNFLENTPYLVHLLQLKKKKTFRINSKKLTSQALLIRTRLLKRWIALVIHRMNHYLEDKH